MAMPAESDGNIIGWCSLCGSRSADPLRELALASPRPMVPRSRARERRRRALGDRRSFHHSVGAGDERRRNYEAERLRGPEVDDQFESGWLQHWQIGRARLLEHERGIRALLAIHIGKVRSIAHQAARRGEIAPFVECRDAIARGERNDLLALGIEERI